MTSLRLLYRIILFTLIQTRTPKDMLGRVMSLVMFSNTGMVPISQAISGVVSKWNLTLLFVGAGALMVLVAVWTVMQPSMKAYTESLTTPQIVSQGEGA